MKSDPEFDLLIDALRDDLPSERDSARLRARLSALGLAASHALVSSSAAAAGAAPGMAQGAAALGAAGKVASQAGAVSLALKAGAVVVVSATVMAGPLWIAQQRSVAVAPTMSGAGDARVASNARATHPTRAAMPAERTPASPNESGPAEAAPSPSEGALARESAQSKALPAPVAATTGGALRAPIAARTNAAEEALSRAAAPSSAAPPAQTPTAASTAGFAKDDQRAVAALPAVANEPTTLREETALVDGALAALRAGDSQRALALLSEHRRRFPNGLLARERERALRKANELGAQRGAQ